MNNPAPHAWSRRTLLSAAAAGAVGSVLARRSEAESESSTGAALDASRMNGKVTIDRIEAFPLVYPTKGRFKFFEDARGNSTGRPTVVVKITASDGTVGWVQGVGPTNVGKLIIEGGGSFSMTGGYAMFVARSYGDPAGTGMIIVKDSGSFSCTTAMLYLGLSELEGASDTQHGVFQVIGGGGSINAPQFRAFRGAEVIAFPKANGPSGLTTIECEYLIHKTTDATADTNTTLTVAPHY